MNVLQDKEKLSAAFREILDKYGVSILEETDRLTGLLMDYAPQYNKERKILMEVIKLGVAKDLLMVRGKSAREITAMVNKCYARIDSELMVQKAAAEYAVTLLAAALQVDISHEKAVANAGKTAIPATPVTPATPATPDKVLGADQEKKGIVNTGKTAAPDKAAGADQEKKGIVNTGKTAPDKASGAKQEEKVTTSTGKTAEPDKVSDAKQENVRNKTADTKNDISLKNYPACKCLRILTYLLIAFFAYGEWQWLQNSSELSTPIGKNWGILGTIICGLIMVLLYDGDLSSNSVQDSIFFYIIALLLPLNTTAFSTIVKLWSDWQQSKEGWTPVLSWSSPSSVWWVVYVIFLLLIILIAALSASLQKRKVELLCQYSQKSEESLLVETESILLQYLTYVGLLTCFYGLFAIGGLLSPIDYGVVLAVIIGNSIIFSGISDLWIGKLSVSAFLMWIIPTFLMGAASIDTFMKWYRYLYSDVGNIEYALYFGLGVYFVVTAVLAFRIRDRRKQLGF